jgi:hypothetical protein
MATDQAKPREPLRFEERRRVLSEVVPAIVGEGVSPCGRVRAFVGHECELLRLEWDWERLKEQLAGKRGTVNELVGAQELAQLVEYAVIVAVNDRQVKVTDAFHAPAPTRAALAEGYRDEYWSLPEHLRPDSEDEYVRERLAAHGPKPDPQGQAEADIAASHERFGAVVAELESDPGKIRASEPGVVLPAGVAEAKEDAARLVERLSQLDPQKARFEGKDDEHTPSVIVTATFQSPFGLWLHPDVFARVGSKLDKAIIKCAAGAKTKLAASIRLSGEESDDSKP